MSLLQSEQKTQTTTDTDDKKTKGSLPLIVTPVGKRDAFGHIVDDPFDTQEELPAMFLGQDNVEETRSGAMPSALPTPASSSRNARWNTSDLIRALLPEELAEEIVSSSSLLTFPVKQTSKEETRPELSFSVMDPFGVPEEVFSSSPKPSTSFGELKKAISTKAYDLMYRCFHEEKAHGVIYAALFEMDSRRCLASLCLDNSALFEEEVVSESVAVLWVLFRTMREANIEGELQEVLVSMDHQHHILVPISSNATVFLYIAFRKDWGTPSLMRLYFRRLREELETLVESSLSDG